MKYFHPILFFDARGSGRSQIKADLSNYSISTFSEEIDAMRKTFFQDRKAIIMAHSFGGIVAMRYAADFTENLEKLVLIYSADPQYSPKLTMSYIKAGLPPRNQTEANEWLAGKINTIYAPYFQDVSYMKIFDNTTVTFAILQKVGGAKYDLSASLAEINIPVLLTVGGEKEYP